MARSSWGLWVLLLLAACATTSNGAWRHVRLRKYVIGDGRAADTEVPVTILWRSAATHDDCQADMHKAAAVEARAAKSGDEKESAAARRDVEQAFWSPRIDSCGAGNVLALNHNESVEVLDDPGPCGPKLLHVRVARNRDPRATQESTGCVEPAYVTTDPQEALQHGKWVLLIPLPGDDGKDTGWRAMDPPYDTMLACEQHRLTMKQYVEQHDGGDAAVHAIEAGRCLHDEEVAALTAGR